MQDIYIARLASPWAVTGPRTMLSTPGYPWELHSGSVPVKVNESPEPLVHDGWVFVSYSGSGCWTPDYALGLLSAPVGANLLQASSWTTPAQPVFSSNPAASRSRSPPRCLSRPVIPERPDRGPAAPA